MNEEKQIETFLGSRCPNCSTPNMHVNITGKREEAIEKGWIRIKEEPFPGATGHSALCNACGQTYPVNLEEFLTFGVEEKTAKDSSQD